MSRRVGVARALAALLLARGLLDPGAAQADAPVSPASAAPEAPPDPGPIATTGGAELSQGTLPVGLSASLRLGWGFPLGDAFRTASGTKSLAGEFSGLFLPVQGDFGIVLARRFVLGGYLGMFGYPVLRAHGSGVAAMECHAPGVQRCSGSVQTFRLGVQALARFWVDRPIQPWAGLGAGFEYVEYLLDDGDVEPHRVAYWGPEIVNVQAGVDFRLTRHLKVGPYASLGVGQYNAVDVSGYGGPGIPVAIVGKTRHEWAHLGVRLTVEGDLRRPGSWPPGTPESGAAAPAETAVDGAAPPPPGDARTAPPAPGTPAPLAPPGAPELPAVAEEVPAPELGPPRDPLAPAAATFSLGFAAAASGGRMSDHFGATSDWWGSAPMLDVYLDGGMRVTPHLALVLSVDVALGDGSQKVRDWCAARQLTCGVAAGRISLQARYALTPAARRTVWLAAGTGIELSDLTLEPSGTGYSMTESARQTLTFTGWEFLKLGAGWDLRIRRGIGLGVFAYGSAATYSKVTSDGPRYAVPETLGGRKVHFWFVAGARVVLFP